MQPSLDDDMMTIFGRWVDHFGWRDDKIDLTITDLSAFATPDCVLTAHAPLWGTKPGREDAVPIAEVRRRLRRMLRLGRPARHDMHLAVHPDGDALCVFVRIKLRFVAIPITFRTVSMAFVACAARTEKGLRIDDVHEWAAADPDDAVRVLVERHGWSETTAMQPHVAFGAKS